MTAETQELLTVFDDLQDKPKWLKFNKLRGSFFGNTSICPHETVFVSDWIESTIEVDVGDKSKKDEQIKTVMRGFKILYVSDTSKENLLPKGTYLETDLAIEDAPRETFVQTVDGIETTVTRIAAPTNIYHKLIDTLSSLKIECKDLDLVPVAQTEKGHLLVFSVNATFNNIL